jgi:Zn-dependent oligopeptidase
VHDNLSNLIPGTVIGTVIAAIVLACGSALAAEFRPALPAPPASAKAVAKSCLDAITRGRSGLQAAVGISEANRDFSNTPETIENSLAECREAADPLSMLAFVSTAKTMRKAALACGEQVRVFEEETWSRPDLYLALRQYADLKEPLAGEPKRLVDHQLRQFKRHGAALPAKERGRLSKVKEEIRLLEAFFLKNAASTETARDSAVSLSRLLRSREEAARLLGYPSHAHFEYESRMLGNPLAVEWFLDRLASGIRPAGDRQLQTMEGLKALAEPADKKRALHPEERSAYRKKLQDYVLGDAASDIKDGLPLRAFLDGMAELSRSLYGLRLKDAGQAPAWHPDARVLAVLAEQGETLGYLYLDLYARPGKTEETAAFSLLRPRQTSDGLRQPGIAALVASLPRPPKGKQALLPLDQARPMLRAFGKALYLISSRNRYASFSSAEAPWDFAEVPGMVFERWAWSPSGLPTLLPRLANGIPLPRELAQLLPQALAATSALDTLEATARAEFGRRSHTTQVLDLCGELGRISLEIGLLTPPRACGPADLAFLVTDAGRGFGPLWAGVAAEDLFSGFGPKDQPDPIMARRFREVVLDSGATKDPAALVAEFLERPLREQPFIDAVGAGPWKKVQ